MSCHWVSCSVAAGVRAGSRLPDRASAVGCNTLPTTTEVAEVLLFLAECNRNVHWKNLSLLLWRKHTLVGLHMLAHSSVPL